MSDYCRAGPLTVLNGPIDSEVSISGLVAAAVSGAPFPICCGHRLISFDGNHGLSAAPWNTAPSDGGFGVGEASGGEAETF